MIDMEGKDSQGNSVVRWIFGGIIAIAILLLLLWKCSGSQDSYDSSESQNPAALAQQTVPSEQSSMDATTTQPAAEASKAKGANASIVPQDKKREKPIVDMGSTSAKAVPSPVKESTVVVSKPIAKRTEVQETETPELVESYAPIHERSEEKSVIEEPIKEQFVTEQPVVEQPVAEQKVAQRAVNTDSLREALSDSIRRALLAEMQAKNEAPSFNGIALRTNLLYDAALIPTIGAEFDLGKLWSIGFDYNGSWFYSVSRHRYWQTIGGYLMLRRYLKADDEGRPFMGHHFGVYGQLLTFDIEFGDKGWQGAYPNWGGGIEYGYSAWLSNRLNIDFSIGIGYLRLKYKEYDPDGDSFKWRGTYRRNWWGPTKAEVSLKWLLYKRKKHQKANQK